MLTRLIAFDKSETGNYLQILIKLRFACVIKSIL